VGFFGYVGEVCSHAALAADNRPCKQRGLKDFTGWEGHEQMRATRQTALEAFSASCWGAPATSPYLIESDGFSGLDGIPSDAIMSFMGNIVWPRLGAVPFRTDYYPSTTHFIKRRYGRAQDSTILLDTLACLLRNEQVEVWARPRLRTGLLKRVSR